MIARVFKYSFVQARARTLKGQLLSAEDWRFLQNMRTPRHFMRYLTGTAYGAVLGQLAGTVPTVTDFASILYDHFFRQTALMRRAMPKNGAQLVTRWLLRYDAENLKTILRGLWQGGPPVQIASLLYPLGALSQLPVESLLQAGRISTALDLLHPTVFHGPLMHALAQFQAQQRLFPLEMAIDHTAFDHLRAGVKALRGLDRRKAQDIIGALVDGTNLSWLVRFRHVYDIYPEESINYLLAGGTHLSVRDFGKLARATDLHAFRESVPPPLQATIRPVADWEQIQLAVERWFVDRLHKGCMHDPFQIGLPLSYLLLKEIEVKSLECHFSWLTLSEPSDATDAPVRPATRGRSRVQV